MKLKRVLKTTWGSDLKRGIANVELGLSLVTRESQEIPGKISPGALWIAEGDLLLALKLLKSAVAKIKHEREKENRKGGRTGIARDQKNPGCDSSGLAPESRS